MYIGNVFSCDYTRPLPSFINLVDSQDKLKDNLPTLIVGKKVAEGLFGKDQIKILNRTITPSTTWCYSLREKANDYETHIDEFIKKAFDYVKGDITYKFVSLQTTDMKKLRALMRYIKYNKARKTIFINNHHVYIYEEGRNIVVGISLSEAEYLGVKEDKLKNLLYYNKHNIIYRDYGKVDFSIKKLLGNDTWLVPFIFAKQP